MKLEFKHFTLVLPLAIAICTLSCSDNDDDAVNNDRTVNALNVFKGGLLSSVDGMTLTYDQNRLVLLSDNTSYYYSTVVTFEYSDNGKVTMTRTNGSSKGVYSIFLNENGFANSFSGGQDYYIAFSYNEDGQLETINGDDMCTLTYENGDLVKIQDHDEGFPQDDITITYTSCENKGCVFPIDYLMSGGWKGEGLEYMYYAGMLGKPTKHLPATATRYDLDESGKASYDYKTTFTWQLDNNGYPASVIIKRGDNNKTFEYKFK